MLSQMMTRKDENNRIEYLVDKQGTVLAATERNDLHKNLFSLYKIEKNDFYDKFFSIKIENQQYYATVQEVKNSSLKIVSFVPKSEYSDLLESATIEIVLIGFALQIISFTCCYYIVQRTYRPIEKIANTFKYHFPDKIENFEDEIDYINEKVENTITANESLERELPKALENFHKSQVKALQSQLNPHFLYNTLDNIKAISVDLLNIDNPIEKSLIHLNNILSESINQNNTIIPLSYEIGITKSYIEIMKMRYYDNFDVEWHIEDGLMNCNVIKLIMQPVIENSIIHGFSTFGENQLIKIDISSSDGRLFIKIGDNGKGISEHDLKVINQKLKKPSDNNNNKHIGLINTQLRIQLLYGNQYGLEIANLNCGGTVCTIIIPKEDDLY